MNLYVRLEFIQWIWNNLGLHSQLLLGISIGIIKTKYFNTVFLFKGSTIRSYCDGFEPIQEEFQTLLDLIECFRRHY